MGQEGTAGGQWMDDREWALWTGERAARQPAAKPSEAKGPSKARLCANLLAACRTGDRKGAAEALALGASPNARVKSKDGASAFGIAIGAGHEELALDLLRAGGWPGPTRYDAAKCQEFERGAAEGFGEKALRELGAQALTLFMRHGKTWKGVKQARDLSAPGVSDSELSDWALKNTRSDLALAAGMEGAMPTAKGWDLLANLVRRWSNGIKDHPRRSELMRLVALPGSLAQAGEEAVRGLFEAAVRGSDVELARSLLDMRLRPGPDWTVEGHIDWRLSRRAPELDRSYRCSLAWAAAKAEGPEFWAFAKGCAPAMEAARARAEPPWSMAEAPIGRVMELMEAGVDIGGLDRQGRGLAHVWALVDDRPRDGWATLARKAPAVFGAKDSDGKTGADRMAEKLMGKDRDAFLADVSRIEGREIRREVAAPKAAKSAPKRARL